VFVVAGVLHDDDDGVSSILFRRWCQTTMMMSIKAGQNSGRKNTPHQTRLLFLSLFAFSFRRSRVKNNNRYYTAER
jgi:hypothetical protein